MQVLQLQISAVPKSLRIAARKLDVYFLLVGPDIFSGFTPLLAMVCQRAIWLLAKRDQIKRCM